MQISNSQKNKKSELLKNLFILIKKKLIKAEVDRAVFWGVLLKIWLMISGVVSALLISIRFTPELQGYYYTFASLVALQVFVELGLGTVVMQFASHEWSKLNLNLKGEVDGNPIALSRLASLLQFTLKWYGIGAIIVIIGLEVIGYVFFGSRPANNIRWGMPWLILCIFVGFTFFMLPLWSVLEGCNQIAGVYWFRFINALLSSIFIWLAIIIGAGLWTSVVTAVVAIIWGLIFLQYRYMRFFKTLLNVDIVERINWKAEMFPMQWRITLSWLSGYFCFSLFTPVLFHYHGDIAAGQMGMSWGIISVLSMTSAMWVNAKMPRFGMLIAKKEYQELDQVFVRTGIISVGVGCIGAVGLWIIFYLLNFISVPLSNRIIHPLPMGLFLLSTVLQQVSVSLSVYLRAHKREPFFVLSLISGGLIGFSTWILGKYYSVTGMAAGYLIINAILTPFAVLVWHRCRNEWHSDKNETI